MNKPVKLKAVQSDSKALNIITRIVVVLVALGAAVLSFDALTALATAAGIRPEFAWIWAVVIDGFILVATFAAFALKDRDGKAKYYAWFTLAIFVLFSILGNAWHAAISKQDFVLPLAVAVLVTALPPLALFLAIHLLIIMVSPTHEQKEEHRREIERAERIYKIKQREIEKIEELTAINEIRGEAGLEIYTVLPGSRAKKPIIAPQILSTAISLPQKALTTPSPSMPVGSVLEGRPDSGSTVVTGENIPQTEQEILAKLNGLLMQGQALPTGKAVADMLGKSERTGQNFIKKFKEDNNLI